MDWSYDDFKDGILTLIGINLSLYKERQMKRRIDALIARNNIKGYKNYYSKLITDKVLLDQFTNYLTINVSEFYRNPGQWQILDNEIIPMLLKDQKPLKIWSAACSTGEEPYSLAMLLSKHLPLEQIRILATDIDDDVLKKAQRGVYLPKALDNLPSEFVKRFFILDQGMYNISNDIKSCVRFKKHDLLQDKFPDGCHLILCRNVMIYFTEEAKASLYKSFYDALHPDGVLFVGSTEQIILSHRYNLKSAKIFFYQRM